MNINVLGRDLPGWILAATMAIVLFGLLFFGWRAVAGSDDYAGPSKAVHAGQYDLKAEVMKMRAAKENDAPVR